MTVYVNVRLKSDERATTWRQEWRQVDAPTLREAVAIAQKMPDVAMCLEASFIPGVVI